MAPQYVLAPPVPPPWRFARDDFAARIRRRWPHARIGAQDPSGAPMLLHALIPIGPLHCDLGVALDTNGWVVILNPAEVGTVAEFAVWYATQLPACDPPVHLVVDDRAATVALHPDIRPDELLAELDPLPVPRPDPNLVGAAAAEICDRIVSCEEYRRLAADAHTCLHRWATFTGLPLIARLDLTSDAGPLLREAMRALALRAAVHRLTESDDTAAMLTVPAPIDDVIRVVLAQYTRCVRMSQQLAIRFIRQLTPWEHIGWRHGDYTHHTYLATGWGDPDQRYWLDADEATRRLTTLNRRYLDIGIHSAGRHTLRFEHLPDPSMVAT
jgi:hypothetical protein